MICQCSIFLEHQEYRDIVYDFIVQLVPLASLPLLSPQYIELLYNSDLVSLNYILALYRVISFGYV